LPSAKNTSQTLKLFLTDGVIKVFSKYNILTERELSPKIEIKLENYSKTKKSLKL
jgi:glutamine synthetase type III